MKIAVIGSGSWATAIVKILSDSPIIDQVNWWMRKQEYVDLFKRHKHNTNYLSSILFDTDKVQATNEIQACIEKSDIIIIAIPSAFLHNILSSISEDVFKNKKIVSAIKGLIPETMQIISDYLHTQFKVPIEQIACIGGPCHAEEVAREKLSYLTIASENIQLAEELADLFNCRYVKCIASNDIVGIEHSAVLKNIYAIASGIANGLGYGDNFKAVLISAAIREMELFLYELGIESIRVNESAYLGDLLVTAYSQLSRNRTFGNMLGREYSVVSAQMEMKMIAEGYYSSKQIYLLNQRIGASMPIMEAVYKIIYKDVNSRRAFEELASNLN